MLTAIDYYLSLASPYAYLGHNRLGQIAATQGATVRIRPVDTPRIFAATGGVPLAKRPPARQAYRLVELGRWASHLGVLMTLEPKYFPVDDSLAARAVIAADRQSQDAFALAGAFLRAVWVEQRNIADRSTVAEILTETGLDPAAVLAQADQDDTAALRQAYTDDAIAAGVFGVPSYVLKNELFWGQDRLDMVDRALGG
ncbi:MAG: 2-hydroxychromene-2-carboxylate isomerase [Inquilinaceae bacterium]